MQSQIVGFATPVTLAWMLEVQINLNDLDCHLLFPTPRGRLWRERTFYRDLWKPTQEAAGLDIRPHECRHSYVTHLRAAGINDADLAEIVGHRIETMLSCYTHAVGRVLDSFETPSGEAKPRCLGLAISVLKLIMIAELLSFDKHS